MASLSFSVSSLNVSVPRFQASAWVSASIVSGRGDCFNSLKIFFTGRNQADTAHCCCLRSYPLRNEAERPVSAASSIPGQITAEIPEDLDDQIDQIKKVVKKIHDAIQIGGFCGYLSRFPVHC
jgi:hypothetical protein